MLGQQRLHLAPERRVAGARAARKAKRSLLRASALRETAPRLAASAQVSSWQLRLDCPTRPGGFLPEWKSARRVALTTTGRRTVSGTPRRATLSLPHASPRHDRPRSGCRCDNRRSSWHESSVSRTAAACLRDTSDVRRGYRAQTSHVCKGRSASSTPSRPPGHIASSDRLSKRSGASCASVRLTLFVRAPRRLTFGGSLGRACSIGAGVTAGGCGGSAACCAAGAAVDIGVFVSSGDDACLRRIAVMSRATTPIATHANERDVACSGGGS